MRKTKSLLALLCAVVAAFVLAVPAFAATGPHTITINSKTDGHTFEAYQIFSGKLDTEEDTLTSIDWGDGVKGTELLAALKATEGNPFASYSGGNPFAEATDAADVAKAVESFKDSAQWVDTFADMVDKYLTGTPSATQDESTGTGPYVYTIENVAPGYYFIKDQDGSLAGGDNAYTKFILEVVHNVTVEAKADVPPIDKSITGVEEKDMNLDNTDAAIGDDVEFTLKSRVPNMDGYNRYKFVVTDTLSKGLSLAEGFGTDDVTITFTSGEQSYTVPEANYTVSADPAADGATTLKIVFKNFIQYAGSTEAPTSPSYEGWGITIVYHATVDQDAVIGNQGNPNTVRLEYTNDPNYDYEPGDEPGDDEPTGITPDSKVTVFVTGLEIIKTDENNQPLTGAEFKLEGTALNTVMVTRGEFQENNESGTYYKLKDGTYTKQAPTEDTEDKYQSTTTKYKLANVTEPVIKAEQVEYKGYVGTDGVIRFNGLKGLADGTYTLTETVVPDGYNGIEPITFTVTFHAPDGDTPASWTFTSDDATFIDKGGEQGPALGVYSTTVINKSGATLPSTGGIGTTIFYAVGATLVIGAGVVLVSRYRANHMK